MFYIERGKWFSLVLKGIKTMTTMTCVHASNLLNDAAFKAGEEYQCYRDENKKVFVVDANGFHIELQSGFTGVDGKSVWGVQDDNGTYHFKRN